MYNYSIRSNVKRKSLTIKRYFKKINEILSKYGKCLNRLLERKIIK